MNRDKLIRKAKALLAMSESAVSEQEAMLAASRLHKLLAKYNLSIDSLQDSEDSVGEDRMEGVNWPWKRKVFASVARLYFCKPYTSMTRKNYTNYIMVGTETNRMFAMHIVKNIFTFIEAQAKVSSMGKRGKLDSTYITAFRNGAQIRISNRCFHLRTEAEEGKMEDEEGCLLPAMLDTYTLHLTRNEEWLSTRVALKSDNGRTKAYDPEADKDGKAAGDKVQLSRALQNKESPKLLGN